jgi:hypothetical protein
MKKPWRRSSRNKPLGEMLTINQHIDKLAAARVDFTAWGMLNGPSTIAMGRLFNVDPPDPEDLSVDDNDNDHEAVEGPRVLNHVSLAKIHGMHRLLHAHTC